MRVVAALLCLSLAAPALAQSVASGSRAVLRGLDKHSGQTTDLPVEVGAAVEYGRMRIDLLACRYPADNPEADAFAFLTISDLRNGERLFQGWMMASAPALNALDHGRFDVWVLSCR